MKKTLILVFLSLFCSIAYSQSEKLPVGKYYGKKDLRDFFNAVNSEGDLKKFSVHAGYQPTWFLNATFAGSKESGLIKQEYGYTLGGKITLFPVILDCNYFESDYSSADVSFFISDSASIRHRGFEFSLSAVLFPIAYKTTPFIMPNLGVGYQSAQLAVFNNTKFFSSNKEEDLISSSGTSGLIWRFGVLWNLGNTFVLSTDYKQSLLLKDRKAFHQLSATLGIRLF